MRLYFIFIATLFVSTAVSAQDTLPKFTVKNLGNDHIVVSWVNNYPALKQLSILTSHDSLKNYRTLISLTDPNARTNGFADTKAPHGHMFYRLFVVEEDGNYFFTGVKRPELDTLQAVQPVAKIIEQKQPGFVPSFYVYTNKDGYVYLNLPDAEKQKYHIKFYEEDGTFLFEIKTIRQSGLTLDKTNFVHAGWFNFELYNDEKLVEKHKFYLAKEF